MPRRMLITPTSNKNSYRSRLYATEKVPRSECGEAVEYHLPVSNGNETKLSITSAPRIENRFAVMRVHGSFQVFYRQIALKGEHRLRLRFRNSSSRKLAIEPYEYLWDTCLATTQFS